MESETRREYKKQWRAKKLAEDPDYDRRLKRAAKERQPKKPAKVRDAWEQYRLEKQREYQKAFKARNPDYQQRYKKSLGEPK
jgi:hypothetical protein